MAPEGSLGDTKSPQSLKVLVVDASADSQFIQALLRHNYGEQVEVTCVTEPERALDELQVPTYDVGLINYEFDGGSGLELIKLASSFNAQVPFVLLTHKESHSLNEEAIEAGVMDCLSIDSLTASLLDHSIRYAMKRIRADQALRESKDELISNMLDLRDAKERAESQSKLHIQMAEETENRYRLLVDNSPVGIWHISVDGYTLYMNEAAQAMFEINEGDSMRGLTCDTLVAPDDRDLMKETHLGWIYGKHQGLEVRVNGQRTGAQRHLEISGVPMDQTNGIADTVLITAVDITGRKHAESAIQHMAHHDALTGLPNRILFADRLNQAVANAKRNDNFVAVMFLDLDEFKDINDTMGHTVGDHLLKEVAERLAGLARDTDTVVRLGGDEFSIICSNLMQAEEIHRLAQRVVDAIARPFHIDGNEIFTSISIGISIYPTDTKDPDCQRRSKIGPKGGVKLGHLM